MTAEPTTTTTPATNSASQSAAALPVAGANVATTSLSPAAPGSESAHFTITVGKADPRNAARIADLIADAFDPLAPTRWLVPARQARPKVMPAYFRIFVDFALDEGGLYQATVNGELAGAAVWLRVVPGLGDKPSVYPQRLEQATRGWADRFRDFDIALSEHHPDDEHTPIHDHLALLAVTPALHGHSVGSALLQAHHMYLDGEYRPAYLEAGDTRSRQLYLRHGYKDLDPPIQLPDGGPVMWPMWREPEIEPTPADEPEPPAAAPPPPDIPVRDTTAAHDLVAGRREQSWRTFPHSGLMPGN